MREVLVEGVVLQGRKVVQGLAVVIADGVIEAVVPEAEIPAHAHRTSLEGRLLVPGFIDTQVNGGGGVLFNDEPTVEGIAAIGAAHRRFGTTGFLPTLISDDLETVARAIAASEDAIAAGVPGVLGVHIEGPVLNPERKGIHDDSKFTPLSPALFDLLSTPRRGRTLVTLAPERVHPQDISRLTAAGVIVSAGHTNATHAEMRAALDAGLRGFTHLFNAMSPLTARRPGAVGAALEDQNAWCGLIVDGRHVDPVTLRIALKCRPLDRFMLVTDAMPTVGSDRKDFDLQGRRIQVRDGVCVSSDGALAGSDLDMAAAVRNAMSLLGLDVGESIMLATAAPARFLNLEKQLGAIERGMSADLVLLGQGMQVVRDWRLSGRSTSGLEG